MHALLQMTAEPIKPVYMLQPIKVIKPGGKPPLRNLMNTITCRKYIPNSHLLFYNKIYIPILLKLCQHILSMPNHCTELIPGMSTEMTFFVPTLIVCMHACSLYNKTLHIDNYNINGGVIGHMQLGQYTKNLQKKKGQ